MKRVQKRITLLIYIQRKVVWRGETGKRLKGGAFSSRTRNIDEKRGFVLGQTLIDALLQIVASMPLYITTANKRLPLVQFTGRHSSPLVAFGVGLGKGFSRLSKLNSKGLPLGFNRQTVRLTNKPSVRPTDQDNRLGGRW